MDEGGGGVQLPELRTPEPLSRWEAPYIACTADRTSVEPPISQLVTQESIWVQPALQPTQPTYAETKKVSLTVFSHAHLVEAISESTSGTACAPHVLRVSRFASSICDRL